MNIEIELTWDKDCPNVNAAREALREALRAAGLPVEWKEWRIGIDALPDHATGYGSPTIFVNGEEVTGHGGGTSDDCCRVYLSDQGLRGAPSVADILSAVDRAAGTRPA